MSCHAACRLGVITGSAGEATKAGRTALAEEIICVTLWRFIVGRMSGKWSAAEKAKCRIFLCLFNKPLIMAGASGLRVCVCFLPVVVDVIEYSCWAFLHGVLCLGKVHR